MVEFWGWHLLLDIKACEKELIVDEDNHRAFLKALVERIDMVAYGEPVIKHFATHDPEKAGYSIVQLIETSNITGHFVDKNGDAYIDIFSCKPFQPDDAVAVVQEYFNPKNVRVQFIYRLA